VQVYQNTFPAKKLYNKCFTLSECVGRLSNQPNIDILKPILYFFVCKNALPPPKENGCTKVQASSVCVCVGIPLNLSKLK
jgi:hypothetical protein